LINGLERLRASDNLKAQQFFRDMYTQNPAMLSSIYFMGQAFEQAGELEKAAHYYREFGIHAPLSIGFCTERTLSRQDMDQKELEATYHRLLGSYPHQIPLWIDYFKYLLEKRHDEIVGLLASFLLREGFKEWDYLKHTPLYWNVTGFLQVFLGRYMDAKESFLKSQQYDSENIPALLGLGTCSEGSGFFEEAVEHFKSLLIREDTYGIASYLLSDIFLAQKQEIKASNTIEKALEKFGGSLIMLYKKAHIHAHLKMFPELGELYEKIILQEKRFAPIRVLQGMALCEQGRPVEGFSEMSTALACSPENIAIMKNMASMHLQAQEHEKALTLFNEIIDRYPLDYETYMGPGIIFYRQKSYDKACGFFDKALELNPHEPELWLYSGAARFHMGNQNESLRYLENSLSCRSRYAPGWLNLGAFHLCRAHYRAADLPGIFNYYRKNFAASLKSFEKATEMEKNCPELWFNSALAAFSAKRYDRAKSSLEQAMALQPDRAEIMIAHCMLARVNNDLAGHTSTLQQIQQKYPEKYTAWSADYQKTHDPLSYLKPLEIPEDPFTLPLMRPLSSIQPTGLFHLLESSRIF